MVKMLKVEYDELIKRAAELEEFADKLVADFPAENPRPPCGVPFVLEVTEDIWNVIDSDRLDLADGADNLRNLAKSLSGTMKAALIGICWINQATRAFSRWSGI
jgi:hypothetical protein